jgi:hypothetical protein
VESRVYADFLVAQNGGQAPILAGHGHVKRTYRCV